MWGMPPGFDALLRRKYDIMQQQANTGQYSAESQRTGVEAAAKLDNVKAGLLPAESASQIALQKAQGGLYGAQADGVREETKYVGPLARANIGLMGANAFSARRQGGLYGSQATGIDQLNKNFRIGLGMLSDGVDDTPLSSARFRLAPGRQY